MRTNIDIDDVLMAEAQAACGHATKKQTVEEALPPDDQAVAAAGSGCCLRPISLAWQPWAQPEGTTCPPVIVVDSSVTSNRRRGSSD